MNAHQTTESYEEPQDRLSAMVLALCTSAVTVTLLLCSAWLLSQENGVRLVETQPGVDTSRTRLQPERLPQRAGQRPAAPRPAVVGSAASPSPASNAQPYVVYLVGSEEEAALFSAELGENEAAWVVKTPEDLNRVGAMVHNMEASFSGVGTNGPVTVVDRRQQ